MNPTRMLLALCAMALAVGVTKIAPAAVIYETDFTTKTDGNPFNAGGLLFQDGWLGQNFTNVDPSGSGFANTPSNTVFPRNLNNRGALGNLAGGDGSGETSGPGFNVGDKIRITAEYQFELASRVNAQLAEIGVDNAFASAGFDPSPLGGMQLHYSEFQASSGGALKVFGDLSRNGFSGADNAFALITSGLSIGLDPDGVAGPVDLISDLIGVTFEMTYLGADEWQTSDLSVANATTATQLLNAAADNPAILAETQTIPSSNDLFMSVRWMRTAIPNSSFDSFRYEYTAVIPEPASGLLCLVSLAGLAFARRDGR